MGSRIESVPASSAPYGRYKQPGTLLLSTSTCWDLTTCSCAADMKTKTTIIWTCSLVISLIAESYHAQKFNIHWGPQSMMYLKGKYGKRFTLEDGNNVLEQSLQGFSALLRGIKMLQSLESKKTPKILSWEKILIQNPQER